MGSLPGGGSVIGSLWESPLTFILLTSPKTDDAFFQRQDCEKNNHIQQCLLLGKFSQGIAIVFESTVPKAVSGWNDLGLGDFVDIHNYDTRR